MNGDATTGAGASGPPHPATTVVLLNETILLTKESYDDWRELQDRYVDFTTSLGPFEPDDLLEFIDEEWGVFDLAQVRAFLCDPGALQMTDSGLPPARHAPGYRFAWPDSASKPPMMPRWQWAMVFVTFAGLAGFLWWVSTLDL